MSTDLDDKHAAQTIKLAGVDDSGNETEWAAVEVSIDGKRRLLTDGIINIEQTKGFDNYADAWFYIGTEWDTAGVGAASDTITVHINAGPDPVLFPVVNVVTTILAADIAAPNKEIAVADRVVATLNANATFKNLWKASRVKSNSVVHVVSKINSYWGERPTAGDFAVTVTGTTIVTVPYSNLIRRNKPIEINRDPNDPRYGASVISGSVTTTPGGIGDQYMEHALNGAAYSLLVNGSVSPIDFLIPTSTTKDIYIQEMRFYGAGNGLKYGQMLKLNQVLANGILVTVKSDDQVLNLFPIKTTEDFKNYFSFSAAGPGAAFRIDIQSGADQFISSFILANPFPIRKVGTFSTDDYIRVRIQDDCRTVGTQLEFIAFGFKREA